MVLQQSSFRFVWQKTGNNVVVESLVKNKDFRPTENRPKFYAFYCQNTQNRIKYRIEFLMHFENRRPFLGTTTV